MIITMKGDKNPIHETIVCSVEFIKAKFFIPQ